MSDLIPVIDGHNDTLQFLYNPTKSSEYDFFEHNEVGHIDLPRARIGGLVGGFFAIFVPEPPGIEEETEPAPGAGYDLPLPAALEFEYAWEMTTAGFAAMRRLAATAPAEVAVVGSVADLEDCLATGRLAVIPHIEGAAAIKSDLSNLDELYALGLRSLGLVWSRPNVFGTGVPFRFPGSPDTGPGLTAAGKGLVRACNERGILVDVSHLNEKGFWDVVDVSDKPIVATHASVHAICASTRNLTDAQIDAIGASGGLMGINFHVPFLRPDGDRIGDMPLTVLADHAAYVAERIGVDHVALGSDFDGAMMPKALGDAAGLPRLLAALAERGFSAAEVRQIAYENWVRVLRSTWN